MYTISNEKLADVTEIVNREIDPAATEELIRTELCADWNEGDDHQHWLDTASAAEIVGWVAGFYMETATAGKEFTVIHGPPYEPHTETVILNGVPQSERLTPKLAAQAARVGCGHRNGVTVWSDDDHGYRLYRNSHKRLKKEAQ